MAKTSQSKKHFHWSNKVNNKDEQQQQQLPSFINSHTKTKPPSPFITNLHSLTIARFRSLLIAKTRTPDRLGPRVVGTLFGSRRGHVHFAFQKNPTSQPAFLIQLQTPISGLVKEMASGLVRIALECDKDKDKEKVNNSCRRRILEEPGWRTYCNGKKCGFATKRECGEKEWRVLKAVEPISMGAGVLPAVKPDEEDDVMYMRAMFERVVGSTDSEAFYMMNPDNGAPELSIYLLRT